MLIVVQFKQCDVISYSEIFCCHVKQLFSFCAICYAYLCFLSFIQFGHVSIKFYFLIHM